MTLIPAFRCSGGAVICADSQETVGGHRVSRQKLKPFTVDNFDVVVGGSGENGHLLDGFVQRLRDELETNPPSPPTIASMKTFIRSHLLDFIKNEISMFPRTQQSMRFAIGVHSHEPQDFEIWQSKGSRLSRIDDYALIGWDEEMYEHTAQRLYKPSLKLSQIIPLAIYLLEIAEDTSNYVKRPFSVAVITKDYPIFLEHSKAISDIEQMTRLYTAQLENMLLTCADTAMSSKEFEQKFREFQDTILQFRLEWFEAAVKRQTLGFFSGRWPDMPYQITPPDTVISVAADGKYFAREDEEFMREMRERMREANESISRLRKALADSMKMSDKVETKLSASQKSEPEQ